MATREIPTSIRSLPLGARLRWARKQAGFSHDRLIERIGRSNRSHLIKVEQGKHMPGFALREAIAEATGVPTELFLDEDDEESDPVADLMRALDRYVDHRSTKERVE